jgi:hypothetical protein
MCPQYRQRRGPTATQVVICPETKSGLSEQDTHQCPCPVSVAPMHRKLLQLFQKKLRGSSGMNVGSK